jgi:torulene dioxygenase
VSKPFFPPVSVRRTCSKHQHCLVATSYHITDASKVVRETGYYPGGSFGNDPCKVIFGSFETTYRDGKHGKGDKDRGVVAVSYVANFPGLARNSTNFGPLTTLVSTTDQNKLQQIDPVTLEPIEMFKYNANGIETNSSITCAHPAIGKEGELYNYILDTTGKKPTYQVFGLSSSGQGRILANITDAPPAYIHSLFSTVNHLVLVIWQCDLTRPPSPANVIDAILPWNPNRPSLFYVISKEDGGVLAKYTGPSFFAFHEINTFEEHGDIVVDLPWYKDHSFLLGAHVETLRAKIGIPDHTRAIDLAGEFVRFRLPSFAKGKAKNGSLVVQKAKVDMHLPFETANIELPKINSAYQGKPYRYAYGIHVQTPGFFSDSIVKVDTHTQTTKIWIPKTQHLPSEPIFIAKPGAKDEDDGVLVFIAMDAERRASALIILDAKNMKEIGRASVPVVIGHAFHGLWAGEMKSGNGHY